MFGGALVRLQRRQGRLQRGHLCLGAGDVHHGAAAGGLQALGHGLAVLLQGHRVLGHGEGMVGVADVQVMAGGLRGHADPGQVERGRRGLRIGLGGFAGAAQAAEQVEIVGHLHPATAQIEHGQLFAQQEGLAGDLCALHAGLGLVVHAAGIQRLLVDGGGAFQIGACGFQPGVGGQRALHQRIQTRVGVQRPPALRQRLAGRDARAAAVEERGLCSASVDGRLGRQVVVRAHGAARAQHAQREGKRRTRISAGAAAQGGHAHGRPAAAGVAVLSSMLTVAVRPAIRRTPSGTLSMAMRTGMRWARRTQSKAGVTLGSSDAPLLR